MRLFVWVGAGYPPGPAAWRLACNNGSLRGLLGDIPGRRLGTGRTMLVNVGSNSMHSVALTSWLGLEGPLGTQDLVLALAPEGGEGGLRGARKWKMTCSEGGGWGPRPHASKLARVLKKTITR